MMGSSSVRTAAILLLLPLVSCADTNPESRPGELSGGLHVFAASSLSEAFTALGDDFEAEHGGVDVVFNFAASSALARQIADGGSADVFASADLANMQKMSESGDATDTPTIARNRMALLVEKGNPKRIETLDDLARSDVTLIQCAPEVPCGKFASVALTKAGVAATPASLEENVKGVVAKVLLGEADVGIVYSTDVKALGDKADGVAIDIADDPALEAIYPMTVIKSAANPRLAREWLDYVLGREGQATLARFGFLAP